jgi:hypothetical protein
MRFARMAIGGLRLRFTSEMMRRGGIWDARGEKFSVVTVPVEYIREGVVPAPSDTLLAPFCSVQMLTSCGTEQFPLPQKLSPSVCPAS